MLLTFLKTYRNFTWAFRSAKVLLLGCSRSGCRLCKGAEARLSADSDSSQLFGLIIADITGDVTGCARDCDAVCRCRCSAETV